MALQHQRRDFLHVWLVISKLAQSAATCTCLIHALNTRMTVKVRLLMLVLAWGDRA